MVPEEVCPKTGGEPTLGSRQEEADKYGSLWLCRRSKLYDSLLQVAGAPLPRHCIKDKRDEGGDRPDGADHPHPLHVLPLHELVRGQGGHLQRAHRQVLAHIYGELLLVASCSGNQLHLCPSTL